MFENSGSGEVRKEAGEKVFVFFFKRGHQHEFYQISSYVGILKISIEPGSFEKRKTDPNLSTGF